ncbi:LAME_0F14400g1_1 [Lachancea meyersii CBS 8951]|uniref:LAME_0F14400g1_1 n=1 Tax=Lachancea meyersii CBS 8951 TaxID=1266667 RepID=A0A1G4JY47_9SACH|nr:LAME_0F14400g1_1 [Lachancea meyersii CBS 8951]
MLVSDVYLLNVLLASFVACFHASREILWFKVQSLFEHGCTALGDRYAALDEPNEHRRNFLSKFYSPFSLSSRRVTKYVQALFASTFALCLVAVELTLWQIVTAESGELSETNDFGPLVWLLVSTALAFILVLVQPFLILSSVLVKFYGDRLKSSSLTLVCCGAILTWVLALNGLNWGPFRSSTSLLTKISIMGVSVMAMLSGVACLSTPYYNFRFLWRKRMGGKANSTSHHIPMLFLNDAALTAKKREYETQIRDSLIVLQKLEKVSEPAPSTLRQQLFDRIRKYQLELAKLQKLSNDPKTMRILKCGLQLGFLIYCIYKLGSTFLHRIPALCIHAINYPHDYDYEKFGKSYADGARSGDPLAVTLAKMCNFLFLGLKEKQQHDSLVKQISLALSLSLFGCSVSTVTTTISYLTTLLPLRFRVLAKKTMSENSAEELLPTSNKRSFKGNTDPSIIKNLLISELTGIYVLATILMVRSNLSRGVAERLNQMLGEKFVVSYIVLDAWFDKVFATTAVLSFIGIKLAEKNAVS